MDIKYPLMRSLYWNDHHRRKSDLNVLKRKLYTAAFSETKYQISKYTEKWSGCFQFSHPDTSGDSFYLACGTYSTLTLNVIQFVSGYTLADAIHYPALSCHMGRHHLYPIQQLEWSLNNSYVYDAAQDCVICKIDVKNGTMTSLVNTVSFGEPRGLCVPKTDKNSSLLYFCTGNGDAVRWDSRMSGKRKENLHKINRIPWNYSSNNSVCSKFMPDSATSAATSTTANYIIDNDSSLTDCELTCSDQILLTSSRNGRLSWWDLRMEKELVTIIDEKESYISSICLDNYDDRVLIYSESGDVHMFHQNQIFSFESLSNKVASLQKINGYQIFKGGKNQYDSKSASFSLNGNYVIAGSDDGNTFVWNAHTCEQVSVIPPPIGDSTERVIAASFVPLPNEADIVAVSYNSPALCLYTADYYGMKKNSNNDLLFNEEVNEADEMEEHEPVHESWEENPIENSISFANCTYSLGYTKQIVYICLACREENDQLAGLCEYCAKFCHEMKGHEIYNIGMKPMFKCDCGTYNKFPRHPCSLLENKDAINVQNRYNHNFRNQWCYCNMPETRPMYQCIGCEDWFHGTCIMVDMDRVENMDYVCENCLQNVFSFLGEYPFMSSDSTPVQNRPRLGFMAHKGRFIPQNWHKLVERHHLARFMQKDRIPSQVRVLQVKRK